MLGIATQHCCQTTDLKWWKDGSQEVNIAYIYSFSCRMFALISLILFLNIGIRQDYMTMLLFDWTINAFYKVIIIVLLLMRLMYQFLHTTMHSLFQPQWLNLFLSLRNYLIPFNDSQMYLNWIASTIVCYVLFLFRCVLSFFLFVWCFFAVVYGCLFFVCFV